jgi:signal transduction histidine kinase
MLLNLMKTFPQFFAICRIRMNRLFASLLLLIPISTFCQPDTVVYSGENRIKVCFSQIRFLESGDSILTLEQTRLLFYQGRFKINRLPDLNLGIAKDNYWVAFVIRNKSGLSSLHLIFENPRINDMDVFVIEADSLIHTWRLGDNFPFHERPAHYNDFSVPLHLKTDATVEVFLFIKHKGNTLQMPVRLVTDNAFLRHIEINYLFLGLISGIFLICFLFGSFILINNHDWLFIFYIGYIFTACAWLWTTEGLAFQFLWPNSPEWATRLGPGISAVSACFFIANCLQFCKPYDDSSLIRKIIFAILIFICIWSITPFMPFIPLTEKTMAIYLTVYFTTNLIIAAMLVSYLLWLAVRGNRIVLYYFFAVLVTIMASVAIVLRGEGILQLPLSSGTIMGLAYVMELILMTAGIARQFYIYRQEKEAALLANVEQQKSITEKILQTQELERVRIGRELHDDIGAGLTQISLMSEVVKRNVQASSSSPKEVEDIALISRRLVNSMGEIVWALNPENKTLDQLMIHLREQLHKLLEYARINYTIQLPAIEEPVSLNNIQLRNTVLITKELVNNAIKYSQAKNITVRGEWINRVLTIEITDDGIGMDIATVKKGNGLRNVQRRSDELNGKFSLASQPGHGTVCRLTVSF